jgi:2,3-bisphosphoglycerate-independent phosphoglycerate mutase
MQSKNMKNPSCLPLILCILDGWGHEKKSKTNAITLAHTPTWDRWRKMFPEILLEASGLAVGLPEGQMGNSEVGHTTLGTGRVVLQDLPRLHNAFETKEIDNLPPILNLIKTLKKSGNACHLMGLFSPGGVHSHQDHLIGLIKILTKEKISLKLHLFLDGRDTPPQSALEYISSLEALLKSYPNVKIATLMGRFYAMDRDQRWDRTQQAYEGIVEGKGLVIQTPYEAIKDFYDQHVTDEFIPPLIMSDYKGMEPNDAFIMVNFRADRVRQILDALVEPSFTSFSCKNRPIFSHQIGMKSYSQTLGRQLEVLFPSFLPHNTLGEILSDAHLRQLRIAETEKYAHVTFFFNGGKETPFVGEERCLIPSPKIKTYDQKPEMSAAELTSVVLQTIGKNKADVIIMNYANTDMVGHTGKLEPTIKAVETVDRCLGELEQAVLSKGGCLFVTADHGNAEIMCDNKTHQAHTAHTTSLVPFVCITRLPYKILKHRGSLKDVAPTLLSFLDITPPVEMTGQPLLEKEKSI